MQQLNTMRQRIICTSLSTHTLAYLQTHVRSYTSIHPSRPWSAHISAPSTASKDTDTWFCYVVTLPTADRVGGWVCWLDGLPRIYVGGFEHNTSDPDDKQACMYARSLTSKVDTEYHYSYQIPPPSQPPAPQLMLAHAPTWLSAFSMRLAH